MAVQGIDNAVLFVNLFVLRFKGAVLFGDLTVERIDDVVFLGDLGVEGVDDAVLLVHLAVEGVDNTVLFVDGVILCCRLVRPGVEGRFAVCYLCIGGFQQVPLVFGLCRYAFELLFEFGVFFA